METVKVTVVQVNTDTTEGRGPMKDHAYFKHEADAKKVHSDIRFVKKYGIMGCSASEHDIQDRTIRIYESAEEYWENHDVQTAKENALRKLTPNERKLLGLE